MSNNNGNRQYLRLYPSKTHPSYWILHSLRQNLENIFSDYLSNRTYSLLIDYGCQSMPYRPLIEPFIDHYIGFDLRDEISKTKVFEPDQYLNDDGTIPVENQTADIVLSTQVLEHVLNTDNYLDECYRVLKQDGLLIISTHGYWKYHPVPEDYWRWTKDGLHHILEKAGFKIDKTVGVLGLAPSGLQLFQDAILLKVPKILHSSFIFLMQSFIKFLDKRYSQFSKDNDACVFIIVARKEENND